MKDDKSNFVDDLIRDYYDLVFRKVAGSFHGNTDIASDITQEVFLKAYKHRAKFKGEASPSTWLYVIVKNEILMEYRKRKQQHRMSNHIDERELDRIPESEHLNVMPAPEMPINPKLLKGLTPEQKSIFMHRMNGYVTSEIMEMTGFSSAKTKSLFYRARGSVRGNLKRRTLKSLPQAVYDYINNPERYKSKRPKYLKPDAKDLPPSVYSYIERKAKVIRKKENVIRFERRDKKPRTNKRLWNYNKRAVNE